MSESHIFDSPHNAQWGVRKEYVSVNIDSEVIRQEVYVDTETGLDIDSHSGAFCTREETIKTITDVYNIGKVSMRSDLERYNKWMRGEEGNNSGDGPSSKRPVRKDIFAPNEEKVALMMQGKQRHRNAFDGSGSDVSGKGAYSSTGENNPFLNRHKPHYRLMKAQNIKGKGNQDYFTKGRYREAIFMYKNALQWLVIMLPADTFTHCGLSTISAMCSIQERCAEKPDTSHSSILQYCDNTDIISNGITSSILPPSDPLHGCDKLTSSELSEFTALASVLLSNMAEALIRLGRYSEGFSAATQSIECDEGSIKGLYRAVVSCLEAAKETDLKIESLSHSKRAESFAKLGLCLIEGKRSGMTIRECCMSVFRDGTHDTSQIRQLASANRCRTAERFDFSVLSEEDRLSWISVEKALKDIVSECEYSRSSATTNNSAVKETQDERPQNMNRAYVNKVGYASLYQSVFCR